MGSRPSTNAKTRSPTRHAPHHNSNEVWPPTVRALLTTKCHWTSIHPRDDDGRDSRRRVHFAGREVSTDNHVSDLRDDDVGGYNVGGDMYDCDVGWDASVTAR